MTPLELAATAAGAAGTVVALAAAGGLLIRGERRLRQAVNGLVGDGRTLGVLGRLDRHDELLGAIQAQLSPDHGGSLHDVMVRVDDRTLRMERRLDEHLASPHPRR